MEQKDLIISLIQQDLKHNQLTGGLRQLGLHADVHTLEIVEVVAQLMGLPTDGISEAWAHTYFGFLERAPGYPVTERAESLRPLAEECYYTLRAWERVEGKSKNASFS